jgi:hypothetical protein
MTLSTDVYIQGPVDLNALKYVVQATLAEFDEYGRTPDQQLWEGESDTFRNSWSTTLGQGLPARTFIHYGSDVVWRQLDDVEEDGFVTPAHFASIDFDTAYGYRGPEGQTCSALHVQLMTRVGKWLDEQSVPWKWRDEFTGEIHAAYDGFDTFGKW